MRLSQKTGCGVCFGRRSNFVFRRKTQMKNKKLILGVIALVAVVGILLGVWFATREKPQEGTKNITVTVVHGDGNSKDFRYTTQEEYLGPVLLTEKLVVGEMGQYGLYIESVDGEKAVWEAGAASGAYWSIYIGEEMAVTGADGVVLTDGGVYKLVYTVG
jgi:hypothetical protein